MDTFLCVEQGPSVDLESPWLDNSNSFYEGHSITSENCSVLSDFHLQGIQIMSHQNMFHRFWAKKKTHTQLISLSSWLFNLCNPGVLLTGHRRTEMIVLEVRRKTRRPTWGFLCAEMNFIEK